MSQDRYGCEMEDFMTEESYTKEEWDKIVDEIQEENTMFEQGGGEYYTNIQSPHSLSSELSSIAISETT